jgi:hypothetical protein
MAQKQFRWVLDHPEDIDGGQMVAPGDIVELSPTQQQSEHVMRQINAGSLVPLHPAPEPKAEADKKGDDK